MYIHGKLINIPFQKVSKNNTIALYSQEYYNKYWGIAKEWSDYGYNECHVNKNIE